MKTIKNKCLYFGLFLTIGLGGCFVEDIVQPIEVNDLILHAGQIFPGEYQTFVNTSSPDFVNPLEHFGLEVRITDWEETGEEVEDANTQVSNNAIAEFLITSDSAIMVTEDSVYLPGAELSALFKTERAGRRRFEPRFELDRLIGRNLSFDPLIVQMVCTLEQPLHQTFMVEITMDDGQTFSLQSQMVRVDVE